MSRNVTRAAPGDILPRAIDPERPHLFDPERESRVEPAS